MIKLVLVSCKGLFLCACCIIAGSKMASGGDYGKLSNKHIADLAGVVTLMDMETIAKDYMDFDRMKVAQIKAHHHGTQAKIWGIFEAWASVNPENQVQVSEIHDAILCENWLIKYVLK